MSEKDYFDRVSERIAQFETDEPGSKWVTVRFDNRDAAAIAELVEYLDSSGYDYTIRDTFNE